MKKLLFLVLMSLMMALSTSAYSQNSQALLDVNNLLVIEGGCVDYKSDAEIIKYLEGQGFNLYSNDTFKYSDEDPRLMRLMWFEKNDFSISVRSWVEDGRVWNISLYGDKAQVNRILNNMKQTGWKKDMEDLYSLGEDRDQIYASFEYDSDFDGASIELSFP